MCEDYFGRGAPNFANYTPSNIGSDRPLHKISSIQLEGEGGQSARQDLTRFAQASLSEQIRRVNPRLGRLMGVAFPESVKLNGIQGQDNALPELDQDKQALVWDDSDEGIRVTIGECQQIDRAFDKVITDSFSQELTRFENEAQRAGYGSDGLRSSTFQKVKAICTSVISNRFSQGLAALEQNSHQEVRKQFFSQGHTNLGSADLSKLAESFHPIDWTASSEETLGALEIARVELEVFQEEAKGESENEASPTSPESSPELGEKSAGGELDLDALLGSFANESCVSRADGKWCPGTHNSMICAAFGVKKALHFQTTTTSIQRSPSVPAAQSTASQTNVRVRETVPESELVEQADDSQLNSAPERSPSNNQPNDDHNASDNEAAPDSALLEAFDPADLEF